MYTSSFERDLLDKLSRDLGLYEIPLELAALILVLDHGSIWNGEEIPDSETRQFFEILETESDSESNDSVSRYTRRAHYLKNRQPTGKLKLAIDEVKAALVDSVEKSQIKTAKIHRTIAGDLLATKTTLVCDSVIAWASERGLRLGELIYDYMMGEREIMEAALDGASIKRWKLSYESFSDKEGRRWGEGLPAWATAKLAELESENERLRQAALTKIEPPLETRERTSFENIIGVLLEMMLGKTPSGKPLSVYESQASIIDSMLASYKNVPGISKSNLDRKFAQARRALKAG